MAVYPVFIPKQNTLFVDGTKTAINAKMKSLGIKNFSIGKNPVPKAKLALVKGQIIKPGSIKKPAIKTAGLGSGPGGPNQSPTNTKSRKSAGIGTQNSTTKKGGGSSTTTSSSNKGKGPTLTANKKTSVNKQTLNQKISELAKKVKNKAPNVSMSKITDTIRGVIRKRPLTSVSLAALGGATVAMILKKLGPAAYLAPSQMGSGELSKKSSVPLGPNRPKSKTKEKGSRPKSRITKPSGISVTIMTPISKPKQDKSKSKNNNADAMLSLIVGGKGTTADRMKEIKAEKTLEKKLGRRPSKKELVAYLKKK